MTAAEPEPRADGAATRDLRVRGPWDLGTCRRFWEGFGPQPLPAADDLATDDEVLRTTFLLEGSWAPIRTEVTQHGGTARIRVRPAQEPATGGPIPDLDRAAEQVARFLSLDLDATTWPEVGARDAVIGRAQQTLPGLRPCGFHSPYEAAVWSVLSQRVRIAQGAAVRRRLVDALGEAGAFPTPAALLGADLRLPGRKAEYLRAVARAALDGVLDGAALRSLPGPQALERVRGILGIGPFAAELVVIRGANAPDLLPAHEGRLAQEIGLLYGAGADHAQVAEAWRPWRSWASVHLRALREVRGA